MVTFFVFFYIKNKNLFFLHNIKYYFIYLYSNTALLFNYTKMGYMGLDLSIIIKEFITVINKRLLLGHIYKLFNFYNNKIKYNAFIKNRLLTNKVFKNNKAFENFIKPEILTKDLEFGKVLKLLDMFFFNLREQYLEILEQKEIAF
jgi:hypothetical protein